MHGPRLIHSSALLGELGTALIRLSARKQQVWRRFLTGLVCICLSVWTIVPSASHSPRFLETVEDHLHIIEDHGHSHGVEIDLLWALHGHQHDLADHDHNMAVLAKPGPKSPHTLDGSCWRMSLSDANSAFIGPPRRPPRA